MIQWRDTKTVNKYTNQPNKQGDYLGMQALVWRTQYGWAYTVRVRYGADRTRWIQMSSMRNAFTKQEIAMLAAEATAIEMDSFLYDVAPIGETI